MPHSELPGVSPYQLVDCLPGRPEDEEGQILGAMGLFEKVSTSLTRDIPNRVDVADLGVRGVSGLPEDRILYVVGVKDELDTGGVKIDGASTARRIVINTPYCPDPCMRSSAAEFSSREIIEATGSHRYPSVGCGFRVPNYSGPGGVVGFVEGFIAAVGGGKFLECGSATGDNNVQAYVAFAGIEGKKPGPRAVNSYHGMVILG